MTCKRHNSVAVTAQAVLLQYQLPILHIWRLSHVSVCSKCVLSVLHSLLTNEKFQGQHYHISFPWGESALKACGVFVIIFLFRNIQAKHDKRQTGTLSGQKIPQSTAWVTFLVSPTPERMSNSPN